MQDVDPKTGALHADEWSDESEEDAPLSKLETAPVLNTIHVDEWSEDEDEDPMNGSSPAEAKIEPLQPNLEMETMKKELVHMKSLLASKVISVFSFTRRTPK